MPFAFAINQIIRRLLWCIFTSALVFRFLPDAKANDWKLVQMCRDTGETDVFVSDKGVKVETRRTRITIICKAPDWTVYVFSNLTKKMIKLDLAHYDGQFHMVYTVFGNPNFTSLPLHKFEESKYLNLPIVKFHTLPDFAINQINAYHKRAFSAIFPKYAEFWMAPTVSHQKKICSVLARNYGCPDLNAVPIQLTWETVANDPKQTQLRTIKCEPTTLADKDFDVPKGYKSVKEYQYLNPHTSEGSSDALLYDALKGFKDTYGGLK